MTDELKPNTDDTDDKLDLSAWEAPPPPADLADNVLARMAGTGVTPSIPDETPPRRRRAWVIAGAAAACLALTAGTYALVQGTRRAAPTSGSVAAERAQSLSLDTVRAELDPGARVSWRREGGALHVQQPAGTVAWRVDDGERILIDAGATVASVEASGASLRVEVKMNQMDARVLSGAALTAAAVSMVTIVVYEGYVKVGGSAGQPTVIVQPGSTYTVSPPGPRVSDAPVVGASVPDAPTLADVRLRGNESATIHTTQLPVSVELEVPPSCTLSLGGDDGAQSIVMLDAGIHPYSIECAGKTTAHGMVTVMRDDASEALSAFDAPTVQLKADGRSYKIAPVDHTPRIEVTGGTGTLHVVQANVDRTFKNGVIPQGALEPGTYLFWFDPAKQSTLDITPDEHTPVLYLADVQWGADQVRISGDALVYSQLSVRSMNVPMDGSGRFSMAVTAQNVFALRLANPNRGVHYFVVHRPTHSTVAVASTTVSTSDYLAVLNAAKPKFLECTKEGTPGKQGKVVLNMAIHAAGHVDKATFNESYDPMVGECMIRVTKTLRFPKSSGPMALTFPVIAKNREEKATSGCDVEALKEKGMTNINIGQHAAALDAFEAALKCEDDGYVRQLAFMEACASGNAAKAKLHYKKLTPRQQSKFAQICMRQKPPVPYDDSQPDGGILQGDAEGYLQVTSKPFAKILIDGVDTGLTTPIAGTQLKLPAGKHKVTFLIGDDRFTYPVLIEHGKTATMSKDLQ